MDEAARHRLQQVVAQRLESLSAAGVQTLPKRRQQGTIRAEQVATEAISASGKSAAPAAAEDQSRRAGWNTSHSGSLFAQGDPSAGNASSAATLEVLQHEVAACTRCEELARTRTQTVFGTGDPRARLCFMGEAPGADEDRLGEPFVGRAGQLLNKIIEACRLRREEVYICNVIKCRPPGNRNPLPEEASNCRPFLERQLELVQPEFICCLGAVAAQNLLGTQLSIGKLRGKVHAYRGAKVVCTYHPAYLLRNPAAKKDTWEDMKFLMREMGVEL